MGRSTLLTRIVTIIGGLLLVGLFLRLLTLILQPILPSDLMQILSSGWSMLFGLIGAAWAPLAAAVILGAAVFVTVGRRR